MNILWINKISDSENWRTTQIELTKSLRKRGHNVTLVMEKNIGEKKSNNDEGVTYYPTISNHFLSAIVFGLIIVFYLPLITRKKNTDVILFDATSVWFPFAFSLKLLSIPIILDVRDLPTDKKEFITFEIPIYFSKIFADGLTTITPELKEILEKNYSLKNKNIGIWPSGVSLESFVTSNVNKKNLYPKKSNEFIIIHHGSHGRIHEIKNLIQSIANLDNRIRKNVKLLLVGVHKEAENEYILFCEKTGVKKQVKIIPRVDYKKIPLFLESSDIGIIPLCPEKTCWQVCVPLKTLECLAMGKPVITTNIPAHKRLFEKGKCGVLIDSDDPKKLSDAITRMYKNKKSIDKMGKTGREIVKKYYTWDSIAYNVEDFLRKILVSN